MIRQVGLILTVCSLYAWCNPAVAQSSAPTQDELATAHERLFQHLMTDVEADLPYKCGLPAIAHAVANRDRLLPDLGRALDRVLTRPVLQKSIITGNFRIHYDTSATSPHTPALLDSNYQRINGTADQYADSVAAIIGYVATFEIDSLGYLPPPADLGMGGGPEYDIYILELGSLYGETVFETPIEEAGDRTRYTSFMRIDNDFIFVTPDSNRGLPGLRVTLAHEFHHAIQIGSYGFWTGETYFYEITSTWLEDVLYPGVNDYFQYVRSGLGQFRRPEVSFTTSNGIIEYSRTVWAHYVAKKFGRVTLRRFWEQVRLQKPLAAMDEVFHEPPHLTTFRSAFTEWSIWNYFTGVRSDSVLYYPEGRYYAAITPGVVEFTPPARIVSGSLNFLASRYYDVLIAGDPITIILSNINLAAALANNNTAFPFSLLLNVNKLDDGYRAIGSGVFAKVSVDDPTNWFIKDIFGVAPVGTPFPNPVLADGKSVVNIPVNATTVQSGTLTILSTSLDLIHASTQSSVYLPQLGKHVFRWDIRHDDGEAAASGVYLYVLEVAGQTSKGKIVVIRK